MASIELKPQYTVLYHFILIQKPILPMIYPIFMINLCWVKGGSQNEGDGFELVLASKITLRGNYEQLPWVV